MKYIVLIVLVVNFFSHKMCAQSSSLDEKYLIALLYLKTNKNINKEIKKNFKKSIKFTKKEKIIDFNLSSKIEFIPINWFEEVYIKDSLQRETIINIDSFNIKYKFITYENKVVPRLFNNDNNNSLYLTFSKPVKNILLGELKVNYDKKINNSGLKIGRAMQFLFIFDNTGCIKKVLHVTFHYN
jgi:hypothetical protein